MKNCLVFITVFCVAIFSSQAQESPYVPGEVIVMLKDGAQARNVAENLNEYEGNSSGICFEEELSEIGSIYLFKYDPSVFAEDKILDYFSSSDQVILVQFNHIVENRALPNDPQIGSQWHHEDASDNDIDSDLAWDITTGGQTANGDDIVVCVLEGGGANYNHVDLIDNHWTNTAEIDGNGVDDDGNGYIDDVNGWNTTANNDAVAAGGHGTAVSGMIGAKGNNNNGGAGVNWDVKIMQVDMGGLTESAVIAAYDYPLTMRTMYNASGGTEGAFVVATNASWGIDGANPANYPVWCAYYDTIGAAGILNCGATTNNNFDVDAGGDMPTACSSEYMIGVTATNSSDVRTFSGYGPINIDLAAPGEAVFLPSGSTGYSSTSGTSFASPCVAGAIALLYSAPCSDIATQAVSNPQNTADLVRQYILDGVDVVPNLVGEVGTGGRLNVRNSLDLLLGGCGPLPDCNIVSTALTTDCQIIGNSVEASITLTPTMSENFCSIQTVSFGVSGGSFTTWDISSDGIQNGDSYTISGLLSNTSYDVYFNTDIETGGIESITTGDCDSLVPGCTDSNANNYNSTATLDDGSCTFPCDLVTFSITVDCWGNEVGWTLVSDSDGSTVASVATGTYSGTADFETYTWSACLEEGCYTMTITDSYGDGLDGQSFGCAQNGTYSMTNDTQSSTIFTMGAADYGTSVSHNFCINSGILGCTDSSACNYDSSATTDDGSCAVLDCEGVCGGPAVNDACGVCAGDGTSCSGCMNSSACNFDSSATLDDGSCEFISCSGCTDSSACNYMPSATIDDGSCADFDCAGVCGGTSVEDACGVCNGDDSSCSGCTDSGANNYDSSATIDDGSCEFDQDPCLLADFNNSGLVDIGDLTIFLGQWGCSSDCSTDLDGDGIVSVDDLTLFLAIFGSVCE